VQRSTSREDGFSLLEVMAVVLILGILVSVALLSHSTSTARARTITCESNQHTFDTAVSVYRNEHGIEPNTIDDLRPYVHNYDQAVECPLHDGTALEYVSLLGKVTCDNHPR